MTVEAFHIRPYREEDNASVYEVCLRTGDGGNDATHLYDDPRALGNIYAGPYVTMEPELAFVLEDNQGVCGYVLGAPDSKSFFRAYEREWLPVLRGRHPEPTGDPANWSQTQKVYHEYYHPEIHVPEPHDLYPSHVHIDLLPRAQGRGMGAKMMEAELSALIKLGSPGVHLGVAVSNHRADRFYRKLGFHELIRVKDSLYLARKLP